MDTAVRPVQSGRGRRRRWSAEQKVALAWPNRTGAGRAWDGRKGRLAILIDCADRMVLAWCFATRITDEDLAEMLREAIFRRFGEARAHAQGIEFQRQRARIHVASVPALRASHEIHPCHMPRRSPQSKYGLAEAFFGSFKRDYVYQACLDTVESKNKTRPVHN
jgi:putative transposase